MLVDNTRYNLLEHPFWEKVMFLENNEWVQYISQQNRQIQRIFLQYVLEGFYPLTALSPVVFKKVAVLTDGKAKEFTTMIYETELGLHPFLKDSCYANIPHARQFKHLIESLLPDTELNIPSKLSNQYTRDNSIHTACLTRAIGMAVIIEYNAPSIIWGLEEFVAQWQTYCKVPSSVIKRNFMLEHGLLEGNDSEEQHITMIESMLAEYQDLINIEEFERELVRFKNTYHALLDQVFAKITSLYHHKMIA